ncbi:MAG: hypothetical protein AAB222_09180 [Candidatus Binatota bacterium]
MGSTCQYEPLRQSKGHPGNSIADIATYPWVARYEWHEVRLEEFPNVKRWFGTISS